MQPSSGSVLVLAVGPLTSNKYPYAIISSLDGKKVIVLARDVNEFRTAHADNVKAKLISLGYGTELFDFC